MVGAPTQGLQAQGLRPSTTPSKSCENVCGCWVLLGGLQSMHSPAALPLGCYSKVPPAGPEAMHARGSCHLAQMGRAAPLLCRDPRHLEAAPQHTQCGECTHAAGLRCRKLGIGMGGHTGAHVLAAGSGELGKSQTPNQATCSHLLTVGGSGRTSHKPTSLDIHAGHHAPAPNSP